MVYLYKRLTRTINNLIYRIYLISLHRNSSYIMLELLSFDPNTIEIIRDKLYWMSAPKLPSTRNFLFIGIDNRSVYTPLNHDFGPADLGQIYKFTRQLMRMLNDPAYAQFPLVIYTSLDPAARANAAFLICAFQIIVFCKSANSVWAPFSKLKPELVAYRDASSDLVCSYQCTILDCLKGLEHAIRLEWFDLGTFDLNQYEHYSRLENGDLNWIIPGKMIAFSRPLNDRNEERRFKQMIAEDYVPIFKRFNVGTVVKLNEEIYNERQFINRGINHENLVFPDGSCPDLDTITAFLNICENEKKAVAVHCKAGLGRTGTLIACYAIKHFGFKAADFIGWIRLCRPGSILGPQQQFLIDIEPYLLGLSKKSSPVPYLSKSMFIPKEKEFKQSPSLTHREKVIAMYGEAGQGEYLLGAKERQRTFYRQSLNIFEPKLPPKGFEDSIPNEPKNELNRTLLSKYHSASRGAFVSCVAI